MPPTDAGPDIDVNVLIIWPLNPNTLRNLSAPRDIALVNLFNPTSPPIVGSPSTCVGSISNPNSSLTRTKRLCLVFKSGFAAHLFLNTSSYFPGVSGPEPKGSNP